MVESTFRFTDELRAELSRLGMPGDATQKLVEASQRSEEAIKRARLALASTSNMRACGDDLVAFGSLARHELTPSSDLDYLFIGSDRPDDLDLQNVVIQNLRETLVDGTELLPPGASGLFGSRISAGDLTVNVGLQDDTNHNLTRRILFLEESVSLYDPQVHNETITSILSKYLEARTSPSEMVPRFLLNDIIRYWRTIAVDYHAKSTSSASESAYSLRYLKLLISRKLCFVASLAPLYLFSDREEGVGELEFLCKSFQEPAVLRLVRLLNSVNVSSNGKVEEPIKRVVETFNHFVDKSGDPAWRDAVKTECMLPNPKDSASFGQMRLKGKQLHQDIGEILTSEAMLKFTKEYLLS